MKTPREVLLARHRATEPKLDQIRANALGELSAKSEAQSQAVRKSSVSDTVSGLRMVFGFFRAPRLNVIGIGGVWLLILVFKLATPELRSDNAARSRVSRAVAQAAMAEQQRLLVELNEDNGSRPRKEAPKADATRPRSERRRTTVSA